MRPAIIICVVAALTTAVATAQVASVLTGPARVIDGDTIIVAGEHVRLEGIDAPERDQTCQRDGKAWACGLRATQTLRSLIRDREVTCRVIGRDAYGRALGACSAKQVNLNAAMVRSGFALDFRRYSSAYIADEAAAKADRAGMWSGTFVPPWEWRHRARATAAYPSLQPSGRAGKPAGRRQIKMAVNFGLRAKWKPLPRQRRVTCTRWYEHIQDREPRSFSTSWNSARLMSKRSCEQCQDW
jgi:endonuclease YncB( thermonuclease family)